MNTEHDQALANIARDLTVLQASMLKEQKKLEAIITEKAKALEAVSLENERLRKANKKLNANAKLISRLGDDDRDMDTPSSEDSSPKSSFSAKNGNTTKIEIKRSAVNSVNSVNPVNPEAVASSIVNKNGSNECKVSEKRPPPPPPTGSASGSPSKPPVPSRAAVNRKLLKPPSAPPNPVSNQQQPPLPPARSTSLTTSNKLERADSGRESDLTSDAGEHLNFGEERLSSGGHDEGFCSSHEDNNNSNNSNNNSKVNPSRLLTNHRDVQKPSDIKYRSKIKSTSSLSVLEEHQVAAQGSGSGLHQGQEGHVTTVTYWTEPYL